MLLDKANYLNSFNITGNDSRERSRFVELLKERTTEIEIERIKILEKYADKNDKGEFLKNKIQTRDENNNLTVTEEYRFANENIKKYQKEYDEYMEEDFIIDILEGNKSKIKKIKELLLNSKLHLSTSLL